MEKPGMFRQTPGTIRRGIAETAENATPSPRSGFAAQPERPVWRSFVGHRAFQRANREAIDDEQRRLRESAVDRRRDESMAERAREKAERDRVPKWKSGIGTLSAAYGDGTIEEHDPEGWLDDPVVGTLAAEALFKRDLKAAKDEVDTWGMKLADPSKRGLTAKERENLEVESSLVPETDPRREELKARLAADDERKSDEQKAYEAKARLLEFSQGGVPAWRQRREAAKSIPERQQDVAARAAEIDTAEQSAAAELAEIDGKLSTGVRGAELPVLQQRRAEVVAGQEAIAAERAAPAAAAQQIAADARKQADALDGKPSVPAHERLAGALQAANFFTGATDALTTAKHKEISRGADGKWVAPQMADSIADTGMLDQGVSMIAGGIRSLAGRLGATTTDLDPVISRFQKEHGLSDAEVQTAWNDLGVATRKWEAGEGARVLSTGDLRVNPENSDWLDTAKATAIIEASGASPASKALTLSNLPQIQEAIAQQKASDYQAASAAGVFSPAGFTGEKIPVFSEFAAANPGSVVDQVAAYESRFLSKRNVLQRQYDEWKAAGLAGAMKVDQTLYGLTSFAADSSGLGDTAVGKFAREQGAALAKESAGIKSGAGVDGLLSAAIEETPSLFVQIALTRGMGAGAAALTGSARAGQLAGTLGAFTTAGGQSAGITYSSEIAAGTDPAAAREKAAKAGVNTALITAAFGAGALGGVERVAAGRAAEMTVRDLMALARQKGVVNLAKSPELRKLAGGVVKSAGGEAAEEGLDELLGAFLTADPDSNLADAWSNAMDAAAVGGFIGGAVDVASGAFAQKDAKWEEQKVQSSPEDRAARVNAEMTAADPQAAPATPEEVAAAEEVVGVFGAGPASQELEAKIAAAEGPEAETLRDQRGATAAKEIVEGIQINRELADVEAQAAESLELAETALAEVAALGDPMQAETAAIAVEGARIGTARAPRARGVLKIARGETFETLTDAEVRALGVTRDGKPLKEEELASVGLTKPLVDVAADGAPIILDEALKELEAVSPTARGRVKMTESQARKKAVARQSAPAVETPGVLGSPDAPAGRTFSVTGRAGTVVEVQAADETAAEEAGALALPMGEQVESVVARDQKSSRKGSSPNASPETSTSSKSSASPSIAPTIKKRIARWKQRLGADMTVTDDPAARSTATDVGVVINPSRLVDEAAANGLDGAQAEAWVQSVIDEEIRHFAHLKAAREMWKSSGSPMAFEAWRSDFYGAMWTAEFAGERGDTVAALYGASFDALEPWQKAMEGLRMMSQKLATGAPTEVAKLWTNAGPRIINAIREALKALKAMVSDLSPALQAEVAAIEAQLSKYEQDRRPVSDRTEKPRPVRPPSGDGTAARPNRPAADAGKTQPGGRGTVSGSPSGDRVTFEKDGKTLTGLALRVSTDGSKTIVRTDAGNVLVPTDQLSRQPAESTAAPAPEAGEATGAAGPFSLVGNQIDGEWWSFNDASGTLGIPRAEMPQIAAEDRSAMVQFLRARGIDYVDGRMLPSDLRPSQQEFSAAKVDKARAYQGGDRAILVSSDGYVVDGHHQWLAKWFDAPSEPMRTIRLDAPIRDVLAAVKEMPSVETGGKSSVATIDKPLPQPTAADWRDRTKLVGEHFAGPPNSIVIQLRGLNTVPLGNGEPLVLPLGRDMESTMNAATAAFFPAAEKQDASFRESVIKLIGPDGRAFAALASRGRGKLEAARQDELEKAREVLRGWQKEFDEQQNRASVSTPPPASPAVQDRVEEPAPSGFDQAEYKKLKAALTKAIRSGDREKIIAEAERGLARFETIGFPDDWSRWERAKDDAVQRVLVNEITRPMIAPAPARSQADQALIDAMKDLVEGLEAAALSSDFTRAIPPEKIPALIGVAQQYIAEGITTPEAFAARLSSLAGGKLKPYSQSLWGAFVIVDPTVNAAPDWSAIYAPEDAPAAPTDREEAFENVSRDKKAAMASVIEEAERLALAGQPFTRAQAAEGDPNNVLSKKEMDESIEAGITAAAHEIARTTLDEAQAFARLRKLYDDQPSLTAKTSTSKIDQAYSTPVPLAYVSTLLVEIDAGRDVVLEPTSGHSMLLMGVPDSSTVLANEINPARRFRTLAALPRSAKWGVTGEDATEWTPSKTPTKVISNPPFGQLMGEDGKNVVFQTPAGETTSIDQAIMLRSLESMADDGRAVFIIGGPPKTVKSDAARREYYGRGKQGGFFSYLHENYGVVDHFTVSGDLYAKQGAGWNVDVIVIQGKGRARIALPSAKSPRMLSSWEEVFQTTTLTDEQRIQLNRISEDEMRATVRGMADRLAGIERMGRPEAAGRGTSANRGQDPDREAAAETLRDQGQAGDDAGTRGVDGGSDEVAGSRPAGVVERVDPARESAGTREPARGRRNAARSGADVAAVGKFQAEYRPFSGAKGLDTLLPINMVEPVADAFARIKADLGGDLVGFVRRELGYPDGADISRYLAGEQIDAVAAAIWNFERGGALIIGDQTGIGKGRIAAALMKYAVNKGFTPIFMTQKPTLHDAMLTSDLPDIAGDDVIPAVMDTKLQFDAARDRKLNFGKAYFEQAAKDGALPGDANAVFVTYDQIQADDLPGLTKQDRARARNNDEPPPHGWRLAALKALAPNSVIILDESHLASGQSTRGWRVADVISRSDRVYYSSATSVKRPENMGIYFKTNVGALTGGNVGRIVEMMTAGGVPAMQVVSSMLARDGQYLRRERSFDGVKFTTQIAEESADRDRELADGLTSALRNIVTVQDAMTKAADAINGVIAAAGKRMNVPAANRAKLETTNFSSKLHNIVSQYLLAIKTASAAEAAIKEIRAGKKVVVSVQSTMEAAIDGLEFGGFAMSYKGLVQRYLDQMRFLQSGNRRFGKGEVETFEIKSEPPEEFAEMESWELERMIVTTSRDEKTGDPVVLVNEKVAAELMRRAMWSVFEQARDRVDATDIGDLPISPIDAMRQAVERAGIRTGEITGRKRGIDENGEIYVRPPAEIGQQAQVNVKRGFNDEDLNFLVINQSGSTGISLHASEKAGNKAQRVMIVAQPNLDINEFMQTLGRIHRSGQVVKPEFILLQTALPAEKRPAAILGRKMAMLNANTTSNSKTDVSEGNSAIDIFNKYGDEVVYRIFERDNDLQDQLRPLGSSLAKFFNPETGRAVPLQDAQRAVEEQPDGYIARTITGYLAILPVEEQELFWERTIADYQAFIAYLDQIGQNELEAKALDLSAKTINREVFTEQQEGDSAFSEPSYLETVETKMGKTPLTGEEAVEISRTAKGGAQQSLREYLAAADAFSAEAADKKAKRALKWDDEKRQEFLASQRGHRNVVANALSLLGRFGTVKRDDGNTGLGVIEEIRIDSEHPTTPSKQVAVIRVNDSRDTLRVPVTQINDAFTPDPNESASEWDKTTDVGGERMIATGNLLAAMQSLSGTGKVVTYTTDAGDNRMGILLPKTFAARYSASKARISINTAEKLIERISGGHTVSNSTGTVRWSRADSGLIFLYVPSSRARGGDYWRNPRLNALTRDGEFVERSGTMFAVIDQANVAEAFEILRGLGDSFSSQPDDSLQAAPLGNLPNSDVFEELGESFASNVDMGRAWARGDREFYAFHEMDDVPMLITSQAMLINHAPDQVVALPFGWRDLLSAAPLRDDDTAANTARLTQAGRSRMAGPEIEREARAQQAAFADQGKVVGNPDLANISEDETVRAEMDIVDEMRKFTQAREKKATWEREGRRLAEADESAVVEKWLQNAYSDEGQAVRPEDVVAARVVMERRVKAAGNDLAKHAENAVLLHGYREARANQARVLAAGTDPFKKPEERHRDYLAGVLYSLPPREVADIEGRSLSPAAARAAIRKAVQERLGKVEAALKKMGVTLDEITGGQVFLSMSQAQVMKDAVAKLSPAERSAVKAIQSGATLSDIRKRTGLPEAKIQKLAADLRRELAEKLRAKVAAGMKLEDLRDELKGLRAATLADADIDAELDRILTVGFGIPKEIPTTRLPKRRRAKPVPLEKANWSRPVFTDGLAAYDFDTADRSEIMARVTALRDITGTPGRIDVLEGKAKAKAVRLVGEMNRILAKYGTSADKIMRDGADPDTYRFDITDRRHVMILARTIQALDADIVDKTSELYYSSLLSGLQTMIVNATGVVNTVWQATVERGFDAALNLLFRDPEVASFGEIPHMLRAMKPMLARAWGNAAATWSTETPFFEEDILGRVPDMSRMEEGVTGYKTASIGGMKGRIIRTPGRILMATDEFLNVARASAEVAAMAYRLARATSLKPGTKDFDDFMKKEVNIAGSKSWQMAAQRALAGTFNNALPGQRNVTGKTEKIRTATDMVGGAIYGLTHSKWLKIEDSDGITEKLLKTLPKLLFFPFVRVPFNILKQGIERSLNPVSLVDLSLLFAHNLRVRDGKLTINAAGDKARIIEMVSKQIQGALLMILLAALGEGDDDDLEKMLVITGSRPFGDTKKGERELGYRLGLGPYEVSMRLPGGKRVGFSYGRIEPAATVLGGTIDTLRSAKAAAKGRLTTGEATARILSSFVSQANDKTSLRGAADLQAIMAGEKPLDRYAADRIASFVPNLIKQAVRESDPVFREKPTDFVEMLQRAAWPRGGPAAMDIYGEPQEKKGSSTGRVIDFTDFGTEKVREWDEMLWRYRQKNPTDFYAPQSPATTYEDAGKTVKMNAAQAARFKELAGTRTVALLKLQPFNFTDPTEADIKRFRDTVERGRREVKRALINSATWRNLN